MLSTTLSSFFVQEEGPKSCHTLMPSLLTVLSLPHAVLWVVICAWLAVSEVKPAEFLPETSWHGKQGKAEAKLFLCSRLGCLCFLTSSCILTLDPSVMFSSLCVRSSWKLWFPLLTTNRKMRKLLGNLCSESTGGLLTKHAWQAGLRKYW